MFCFVLANISMSKHVRELLEIALSTEKEAPEAYYILCTINYPKPIIGLILDDSSFTTIASVIIQAQEPNEAIIGRLSALTVIAFVTYPKLAINSCWYLNSLLKYLNNTSVFALFQKVCTYEQSMKPVSNWLKSYGFAQDIIKEFDTIDFDRRIKVEEYYSDSDVFKCMALYEIIIVCSKNPVLISCFACEDMLSILSKSFLSGPPFLTGKRWEAICSLACDLTLPFITPLVANAVSHLYTPHTAPLQDIVETIHFITKSLTLSRAISNYLKNTQILQVLLRYVIQFPDASFLHSAFREFVRKAIKNPDLSLPLLDQYLQLLISETKMRQYGIVACSCWDLLLFIHKKKGKFRIIKTSLKKCRFFKEYKMFEKKYLKKYKKIIQTDYGGSIEVIHKPPVFD